MKIKEELKEEIEKCKECCYVRDMTDSIPPICEYHRGKQEAQKLFKDAVWDWSGKFWDENLRGIIGLFKWNEGIKELLKVLEEK